MRKLIRHKRTKAFLTRNGKWTNVARQAHDFSSDQALSQARENYELQGRGQVYFLFGEEPSRDSDFVISLMDLDLIGPMERLRILWNLRAVD
jgi:hypothetical protein